jgi:DNA gyrase inhibitor GyrI
MMKALSLSLTALLLGGCAVVGAAAAEEPDFELVAEDGPVQIREYGELLVARTRVDGSYEKTGKDGFRRLAGFIFGNNQPQEKVAMTAPVLREPAAKRSDKNQGEKIAMTAPVFQEPSGEAWTMTFVMPAEHSLETLPQPVDPRVEIAIIPPNRVATIRFSGLMDQKKFDRYSRELSAWLEANDHLAVSAPRSAGYNPPWTLPPLRRNEIHIDIE